MLPPEFTRSGGPLSTEKTALVVVHGVADQLPGATARSIVDLLVASSSGTAAYRSIGSHELTLAVPPLTPCFAAKRVDGPTPHAADRSLFKAFLQSYRSDFQRNRWEAPTAKEVLADMKAAKAPAAPSTTPPSPAEKPTTPPADTTAVVAAAHAAGAGEPDRGLALTDYLLGKQRDNGGLQEAYETTCIELERKAAGKTAQVDVYEMYWADLSRLSGAIPRILTEFGTLIFRLSRLGRDTVDEGRGFLRSRTGAPPAWTALTVLQTAIDWLFVNVLAQLFFHLLLFGAALLVLGLARPVVPEHRLHLGVAIVLAVLGVLLLSLSARRFMAIEDLARGDAGAGGGLAVRDRRRGRGHRAGPGRARHRRLRRGPARRRRALSVRPHRRPGALDRAARCRATAIASPASAAPAPRSTPGAARRSTEPS